MLQDTETSGVIVPEIVAVEGVDALFFGPDDAAMIDGLPMDAAPKVPGIAVPEPRKTLYVG